MNPSSSAATAVTGWNVTSILKKADEMYSRCAQFIENYPEIMPILSYLVGLGAALRKLNKLERSKKKLQDKVEAGFQKTQADMQALQASLHSLQEDFRRSTQMGNPDLREVMSSLQELKNMMASKQVENPVDGESGEAS